MDEKRSSPERQKEAPPSNQDAFRFKLLTSMNKYFQYNISKKLAANAFSIFSVIGAEDSDRIHYSALFKKMSEEGKFNAEDLKLSRKESRAIACLLGLGICDALGASTEFIPFEKNRRHLIENDFEDVKRQIKHKVLDARSGKVGIWTDDCSMALCMADSLLLNEFKFDPIHMRYMFNMWLEHGLNNGGRPYSIGLGGNISISMGQFARKQSEYAIEGDKFNNGNGSVMRLAPVPVCFHSNLEEAMKFSGLQSKTTHNGDEAKQCARLLAALLVNLINRGSEQSWREAIDETCKNFHAQVKTVKYLAMSEQEPHELYEQQKKVYRGKFVKFNKKPIDRNWNWKDPEFTYSPCRAEDNPGYIGSYCMDAMAMALHTVWHHHSFKQVALVNANMGGDCDTVGAVAGQIAGAIYGVNEQMLHFYSQMQDFRTGRYDLFLKAFKLFHRSSLQGKKKEE